jgi:hypothetical protein
MPKIGQEAQTPGLAQQPVFSPTARSGAGAFLTRRPYPALAGKPPISRLNRNNVLGNDNLSYNSSGQLWRPVCTGKGSLTLRAGSRVRGEVPTQVSMLKARLARAKPRHLRRRIFVIASPAAGACAF